MVRSVAAAFLIAGSVGCAWAGSIPAVNSEYWKYENFAAYESYSWLPDEGAASRRTQPDDHRLHDMIRGAIDRQLAAREYTSTDASAADFLVTYHCRVSEKVDVEVIYGDWDDAEDTGGSRSEPPRIVYSTFEEGSIVIDFIEPAERKRVWRGIARGRLAPEATTDQLEGIVDRSVEDILDQFPPPD